MRPSGTILFPAFLVLVLADAAFAQGIGDVAARERQRREELKRTRPPVRVFGNEDLPQSEPETDAKKNAEPSTAPASPAGSASGSQEGGSPDDAASVMARRQERIAEAEGAERAARAEVEQIEARIRELQDMLNPMSTRYVYGAASSGDAAGAEARARSELQQSETRLVEARKALAAATAAAEDARLGRLPPR
jgi:hypothetical protein